MPVPSKGLVLDIGAAYIKGMTYKKKNKKIRVYKHFIIETPEGMMEDGRFLEQEVLVETLAKALKDNRIKSKCVLFTLDSMKILTRDIELPALKGRKLKALLLASMSEQFPVELTEYTMVSSIIDTFVDEDKKKNYRIKMTAAWNHLLDNYMDIAKKLSLEIAGIVFEASSTVSFIKRYNLKGDYIYLDMGGTKTSMNIMHDGISEFNRNIFVGMERDPDEFIVADKAKQIGGDVADLLEFYMSRHEELQIDKVYLAGGGAKTPGIDKALGEALGLPVEIVDEPGKTVKAKKTFKKEMLLFSNAIGAVMSEELIVPEEIKAQYRRRKGVRLSIEAAILAAALLAFATYVPIRNLKEMEVKRDNLAVVVENAEDISGLIEEHDKKVAELAYWKAFAEATSSKSEQLVAVLEAMEAAIPAEISYLNLENNESGMTISCVADSKLTAVNLMTILENMDVDGEKVFDEVYIPSITAELPFAEADMSLAKYSFSIECSFREVAAE